MLVPQPLRYNACRLTNVGLGLVPVRSPLLGESLLISFPPGTEMFQFPWVRSLTPMYSAVMTAIHQRGFPHSEISGSKFV